MRLHSDDAAAANHFPLPGHMQEFYNLPSSTWPFIDGLFRMIIHEKKNQTIESENEIKIQGVYHDNRWIMSI